MNPLINSRVIGVLEKVTGKALPDIDYKANLSSQLELDSVQIVELFAGLEKEFDIELPLTLMQVKSASEFMEILETTLLKLSA